MRTVDPFTPTHFTHASMVLCLLILTTTVASNGFEATNAIGGSENRLVYFGPTDAGRLVRNHGFTNVAIDRIYRDSNGSRLFLQFVILPRSQGSYRTAIVSTSGVRVIVSRPAAILDDREGMLYWKEGREYLLQGGQRLFRKAEPSAVGIYYIQSEPTRQFLALSFGGRKPWEIVRVSNTEESLIKLPAGYELREFFARTNTLFIFAKTTQGRSYLQRCLIYTWESPRYVLQEDVSMPWAGNMFDMDPLSGYAKIDGRTDNFTTSYLFNVMTKDRKSLGFKAGQAFFLKEGVAKAISAALR